ncbi:MAG TPA: Hsp20/alpha crystallin family protein [Gemmatimonadales bacterium]|nr:Hsp20/alpha crystallin family protein [Gemmatimonadales bacterium]
MSAITRKPLDPMLDLFYNLQRRMGRVFNEPFGLLDWVPGESTAAWTPVVDIFEEPDLIRITAEIPGVKPEDVKIAIEGNVLTISGTKEQVAEEKAERIHRYERTYGSFERSFTLPATVDTDAIKATYELGLLTIVLPKVEKAKPRQIKVEVGKAEKQLKA